MAKELKELYKKRHGKYIKSKETENFLDSLNKTLQEIEIQLYKQYDVEYPFIFVHGLPRSGTTLMSQVIAHSFDVGFINNFVSRFWLAPLHGINLFKAIYGNQKNTNFQSDYARTSDLSDIHEFGYFWRYWLKKETFKGVTRAKEIESSIDWEGLKRTLANIQHEFRLPMVFKNIFGSYHQVKLSEVLGKVVFVFIERDSLDSAISILDARKSYYSDLNTWWSYMPIEYEMLKDLDYWSQIAGQVYFLKRYYENESSKNNNVVRVSYKNLTQRPKSVLKQIADKVNDLYGHSLDIINEPPEKFKFRTYDNRETEKKKFTELISEFERNYSK